VYIREKTPASSHTHGQPVTLQGNETLHETQSSLSHVNTPANMKFFQGLSVFASVVSALSVDLGKRNSPLEVKIQMVDNSLVEATITNTGSETLRLFKTGTILDSAAVEKTEIFSGCKPFH
jgi:hypothetical protein